MQSLYWSIDNTSWSLDRLFFEARKLKTLWGAYSSARLWHLFDSPR